MRREERVEWVRENDREEAPTERKERSSIVAFPNEQRERETEEVPVTAKGKQEGAKEAGEEGAKVTDEKERDPEATTTREKERGLPSTGSVRKEDDVKERDVPDDKINVDTRFPREKPKEREMKENDNSPKLEIAGVDWRLRAVPNLITPTPSNPSLTTLF
jgi:hypothetical protein